MTSGSFHCVHKSSEIRKESTAPIEVKLVRNRITNILDRILRAVTIVKLHFIARHKMSFT